MGSDLEARLLRAEDTLRGFPLASVEARLAALEQSSGRSGSGAGSGLAAPLVFNTCVLACNAFLRDGVTFALVADQSGATVQIYDNLGVLYATGTTDRYGEVLTWIHLLASQDGSNFTATFSKAGFSSVTITSVVDFAQFAEFIGSIHD